MTKRLLAIDDDPDWLESFQRWITSDLVEQHSASTTEEAVNLLRRYHYDIVLLDLSMDSINEENRDNLAIQNYLATRPEGTAYFIVSAHLRLAEAIAAAYVRNASWQFLKSEMDPEMLRERIRKTLDETVLYQTKFTAEARRMLVENILLEDQIIAALGVGGAPGFSQLLDTVLHKVTPLARHNYRPKLEIQNRTVLGLAWSRQRGKAISLSFANVAVPPEEQAQELVDWLGYKERQPEFDERVFFKRVRVQCFSEPSLSDEHFDLPKIANE
jgi:CheY-like chemotaxis protein